MKKGARARSGVHLFSFPPPQSEESPAGGPRARARARAASFVTLNVLQPPPRPPVPPASGSYEGEGARWEPPSPLCVRACMRDMALAVALSRNIFQELWEILSGNVPR